MYNLICVPLKQGDLEIITRNSSDEYPELQCILTLQGVGAAPSIRSYEYSFNKSNKEFTRLYREDAPSDVIEQNIIEYILNVFEVLLVSYGYTPHIIQDFLQIQDEI